MPTPLASAMITAASRTTSGSTPSHLATPAQTPATMCSSGRRVRPGGKPAMRGRGVEVIGSPDMMTPAGARRLRERVGDIPDCRCARTDRMMAT